ncbi:MAG: TetR/AcrR family transcriptional regulator [Myxococcota bacterium]
MTEGLESDPQRERLLDAAEACLARFGLAKTTAEDVARAAGLSRATVYRQFGSRDALIAAVATREAERCASAAVEHLRRYDDIGDWIVEGILFCLRDIPARPLLVQLGGPAEFVTASRVVLRSDRMRTLGSDVLRPLFERARASGRLVDDFDLDEFSEWVLRALMSFLAVRSAVHRDEEGLRGMLRRMLLPAILKPASAGTNGPGGSSLAVDATNAGGVR